MNKVIKKIVVVLMLIVLFYQCSALSLGFASIESKQLSVTTVDDYIETDAYTIEKKISFKQKKYLGLGRYGFIKCVTIDKASIIEQDLIGPKYSPLVSFGIYHDRTLLSPVKNVSKTSDYVKDIAMEYGNGDGANEDNIIVRLKPGKYYCAVYSLNPFLSSEYKYICHRRMPKTNESVKLNEVIYYDVNSSKQINCFDISLKKGEKEIVLGHECKSIFVENENGKKVYAKEFKNINNKDKKAKFKPDKSGTYVVKINHYSTTFSEEPMKFTIRNISKETENAVRSDKN